MKTLLKSLGALLLVGFVFAGCVTTTIHNVDNAQTINDKKVKLADVENAIQLAGLKRGWIIQKIKPGLLTGELNIRGKHSAIIEIPYSEKGYKIEYKSSQNLKYNPANNSIDNHYNKWITYLANDINSNLGIVQSGGELTNVKMNTKNSPMVHINLKNKTIYMKSSVNYAKNAKIAQNIKAECHIDQQLVDFIKQYVNQQGFNLIISNSIKKSDIELIVEISEVVSRGNAFIGHTKYTAIAGKLMQNGKELSNFKAARYSGGGAFGGYKGSCSVLGRTVETLAKEDVSFWLKNPINGAKLGNTEFITQ